MKYFYLSIFLMIVSVKLYSQKTDFQLPVTAPSTMQSLLKGENSGSSPTVRISCSTGTISGNEPLFVVDGIVYEAKLVKEINPADILEIHILKEPFAQTLYGCRAGNGVVVINTKKSYHRKFVIKDAINLTGIGSATIKAVSEKTSKQFQFTADEFGRMETDSLRSIEYSVTISSTGYKTKTIGLKTILQNNGEIKLEREFVELKEVMIVAYPTISCRSMNSTCLPASLCSRFGCSTYGISITGEHQTAERSYISKKEVQIYPNPVPTSGTLNISFPNVNPGLYQIRLFSAAGQLFYSFQKQISGKGETEQIHLNGKTLPGMYIVQVIDEQKKLLQCSKIVVQ